jgi:hypothetical protein
MVPFENASAGLILQENLDNDKNHKKVFLCEGAGGVHRPAPSHNKERVTTQAIGFNKRVYSP